MTRRGVIRANQLGGFILEHSTAGELGVVPGHRVRVGEHWFVVREVLVREIQGETRTLVAFKPDRAAPAAGDSPDWVAVVEAP